MNIINQFWNTVLTLCSSTERQAILSTPLHFQDAQKGVISTCAKKKKLVMRWYSYRCKMAPVCIRSEITLSNFTSQEGRTPARVLCQWRLSTLSAKGMCWVFWCQITSKHRAGPPPGFLRALIFCSHLLHRADTLSGFIMRRSLKAFNITTVWQTGRCLSP